MATVDADILHALFSYAVQAIRPNLHRLTRLLLLGVDQVSKECRQIATPVLSFCRTLFLVYQLLRHMILVLLQCVSGHLHVSSAVDPISLPMVRWQSKPDFFHDHDGKSIVRIPSDSNFDC